jgi:hypothetical protein
MNDEEPRCSAAVCKTSLFDTSGLQRTLKRLIYFDFMAAAIGANASCFFGRSAALAT